jgi:hypothetical protein
MTAVLSPNAQNRLPLIVASVRRDSVRDGEQVAADQGQVAGLDGGVGAGAHGRARPAWARAAALPVAGRHHHRATIVQLPGRVGFAGRKHPGDHLAAAAGPMPAAYEGVRLALLCRLRALVTVFGPRRLPGWPGICTLVAWLAARFAAGRCWLRVLLGAGEQVDAVAGGQVDAGVGVSQGVVVQDRDRGPAGRPGGVAECVAGGRRAVRPHLLQEADAMLCSMNPATPRVNRSAPWTRPAIGQSKSKSGTKMDRKRLFRPQGRFRLAAVLVQASPQCTGS